MQFYIDPGTGSMLFTVLIGIIGAGIYSLRMLWIKLRFKISGGKIETATKKIPFVFFSDDKDTGKSLSLFVKKWTEEE